MSAWDNKAVKGKDLQEKVLQPIAALIKACSTTANADKVYEVIATAFNDIVARIDGLENDGSVTKDDLQKYCKQRQVAKSSPSASSTAIAFIDTISQNENGDITATKKTVRSATTGQTGVVQLTNSTSSTSTTTAATPASVKSAYDLASGKLSPTGDGKDVTSTVTTENNYTNPGSTATKVSVLFGKIWNFIGRLRTSWQTTPDDTHFPSEKLVKDGLDLKEDLSNKTRLIRGSTEADDTRYPTELATRTVVESTRMLIEKYLRVHCEGVLGVSGWTSITLYSYDSNDPVISTPSGLTGNNIFSTILYKQIDASHAWDPCSKGCEDFLVIKQGHEQELTTYFQLGAIFALPQVRRFKMRLYNNESYRWTVSICHTRTTNEYTGDIIFSTNKSGRYEKNLDIAIEPKRCVTIEVLISTSYYNDLGIPVVFVSTNEEIAS